MVNKTKTINQSFKNLQTQDKKDREGHTVQEISNRSAGIVVVRKNEEADKLLVLMMRAYNYWDFPKGKIELGERVIEAAIRETQEESGISKLKFTWGQAHAQTLPYGIVKKVSYYFLAETEEKDIVMQINPELGRAEHEEYKWLTFDEARKIAVPRIKEILDWAELKIKTLTPNMEKYFLPPVPLARAQTKSPVLEASIRGKEARKEKNKSTHSNKRK